MRNLLCILILIGGLATEAQNIFPQALLGQAAAAAAAASCNNVLLSKNGASVRSDHFWAGCQFTVGATNITVCTLERLAMGSPSTLSHAVKIFSTSGVVASGVVNMTGISVGSFGQVSIAPVTLTAGTSYIIAVDETVGDNWCDLGAVTISGGNLAVFPAYDTSTPTTSASFTVTGAAGSIYSSPNLIFQ